MGCVEGLLDCVDLLYGADVTITMENVQAMFKFCLLYKIEGVFELCLKWVSEQLVLNNLTTFYTMGLFVRRCRVISLPLWTKC